MMKHSVDNNGALLRIERGEELIAALVNFTKETKRTFSFTVLGATTDVELGFYHLERKEYSWRRYSGEFEIVGGVGNAAYFDDQPFVHLHATIADKEFRAYGGHARRLIVGATCEVTLVFHEKTQKRKKDELIGLNLWSFEDE